jgi:Winged helix DNA-binding domain
MNEVLSQRALNRALLARQLLLERSPMPVPEALERLVGMQAQAPMPPYYGLWTRLIDFQPESLSQLLLDREAVRIVLMRGTVHLVTARDCRFLRPVLQPALKQWLLNNSLYGKDLTGIDLAALEAAGRQVVDEKPVTLADLGKRLQAQWPDRNSDSLGQAIRALAPLVQVPPRGIWGKGGLAKCTTAESWLGQSMRDDASNDELVVRYLAGFGPATVADAQTWSGLKKLSDAFERLRPQLITFRDERGRELFDLPDAPRPDPATPAPIRFLPPWDNLLLSHADRTRVIADDRRKQIWTVNGIVPGTILIDGYVAGTWSIKQAKKTASLHIDQFGALSPADRAEIEEEGERLLLFADPKATNTELHIAAASGCLQTQL